MGGSTDAARKLLYLDESGDFAGSPLYRRLCESGWSIKIATNIAEAWQAIESGDVNVGLAPFSTTATQRAHPFEDFLYRSKGIEWIGLMPPDLPAASPAWRIVRDCFYDYHSLPPDAAQLVRTVGHAWGMARVRRMARQWLAADAGEPQMVGTSKVMLELFNGIRKVAAADAPVLISGEGGTGKEMAALAIHERSRRGAGPFIPVNCGALPHGLIQSELFGQEKGTAGSAQQHKLGRFEMAAGGTLFLDEVADLPLELQGSLLRFLEKGTIERIGGSRNIELDVRVIAATNIDLARAVAEKRFREDVYHRLNVLKLTVPPLRDRTGDIEVLAHYFFRKFAAQTGARLHGFSRDALDALLRHRWPGNVRELINRIWRALVMCEDRQIGPADLGFRHERPIHVLRLDEAREAAEREAVGNALIHARGNVTAAARSLGVSRVTLYHLIRKYGIQSAPLRPPRSPWRGSPASSPSLAHSGAAGE